MPRLPDAGIVVLGFVLFLSESVSAIVLGALNVVILWDGNVDGYDRESSVKSCQRSRFSKTVCSSSGERHQKVTYGASVTTASEVFRGDLLVGRFLEYSSYQSCVVHCLFNIASPGVVGLDVVTILLAVVRI